MTQARFYLKGLREGFRWDLGVKDLGFSVGLGEGSGLGIQECGAELKVNRARLLV